MILTAIREWLSKLARFEQASGSRLNLLCVYG